MNQSRNFFTYMSSRDICPNLFATLRKFMEKNSKADLQFYHFKVEIQTFHYLLMFLTPNDRALLTAKQIKLKILDKENGLGINWTTKFLGEVWRRRLMYTFEHSTASLKSIRSFREHIIEKVNKAYSIIGIIKRNFVYI